MYALNQDGLWELSREPPFLVVVVLAMIIGVIG